MRSSAGLLAVCIGLSLSGCHRPTATFQPSRREVFYTPITPRSTAEPAPTTSQPTPAEPAAPPVAYADATPAIPSASVPATQRIQEHHVRAQRLLMPRPAPTPPVAPDQASQPADDLQNGPGPGPKQRKTLREILGLPPKKKLNWWQRISWQLKASIVVILVAVVFAILNITILAIIFGIIGAYLLIRGLKKSFKVRRGIFGLGGG
ncbi:hypothetical protein J2I47_02880 [Fibrella sp. HMF5335]|uniref:Uncharacterized protein n=1 Tax=Fibrella rubiginis TaxID=2817060 RepID=A0A939K1Q0_9BACT|nr:hypothetical protein [Fibrella rubiginis]MBO0935484.1 hypothetical protein [Fibrella rubiginis]